MNFYGDYITIYFMNDCRSKHPRQKREVRESGDREEKEWIAEN